MIEKTFQEMLQLNKGLTGEQLGFLENDDNSIRCRACFLSSTNRGSGVLCGDYVHGSTLPGFGCADVRAEAIRLDSEYKKPVMEKDILNKYEFDEIIRAFEYGGYGAASEKQLDLRNSLYKSQSAALKRIDKLEKLKDNLSAQIDRRDLDWDVERSRFKKRIDELEKNIIELNDSNDAFKFMSESKFQKQRKKIADLKSRLADSTPAQIYTPEEAELKAREKVADFLRSGVDFEFRNDLFHKKYVVNERLQEPDGGSPEYFEFPYAEPREPQPGDLLYYFGPSGCRVFQMSKKDIHPVEKMEMFFQHDGNAYPPSHCKPTGYRVNEDGKVVPISADRGQKRKKINETY